MIIEVPAYDYDQLPDESKPKDLTHKSKAVFQWPPDCLCGGNYVLAAVIRNWENDDLSDGEGVQLSDALVRGKEPMNPWHES
jgi:hypothetical protein